MMELDLTVRQMSPNPKSFHTTPENMGAKNLAECTLNVGRAAAMLRRNVKALRELSPGRVDKHLATIDELDAMYDELYPVYVKPIEDHINV